MRGEDRDDAEPRDDLAHLLGRGAALAKGREGGGERLGHRAPLSLGSRLPLAQHAYALLIFGEIDQLEVGCECLRHDARLRERKRADRGEQLGAGALVAGAMPFRESPNLFDELEQLFAFLFDDRLAEQVAEQVDLVAEPIAGLVAGGGHRRVGISYRNVAQALLPAPL